MKFKDYKFDKTLIGLLSYRIDGVRAHWDGANWTSRENKPLYNLPQLSDKRPQVYEVFLENKEDTLSAVESPTDKQISKEHLFLLYPTTDPRLYVYPSSRPNTATFQDLSPDKLREELEKAVSKGYAGLLARELLGTYHVIKPSYSEDMAVTGLLEGTGNHKGKLGAFITEKGKVGTGLTDKQREQYFDKSLVGATIEVSFVEITKSGKLKHSRFVRLREDRSNEYRS